MRMRNIQGLFVCEMQSCNKTSGVFWAAHHHPSDLKSACQPCMSGMQAFRYFAFWQAYLARLEFYNKPGS